ncbi:MAG: hypothetical protein ACYDAK_11355 [Candidatus Limnocylindrales bacterium]
MTRDPLRRLTRNAEAAPLLESFFIAAVVSFLGIRGFLALTGYPRIGSGGIHIAHMLWGGLLMLLALMLMLAFLDRSVRHLAAVIAGLGFGTFIDEIGKFVTADNDYFYRPAVALIYGLFVIAFFVARTFVGRRRLSGHEALANALDLLARTPDGAIEPGDRTRVHRLLELADPDEPLTRLGKRYLAELPEATERGTLIATTYRRLANGYEELMANPWAERVLTVGVVAYTAAAVSSIALLATAIPARGAAETSSVATIGQIGSTIVGVAFVALGIGSLADSRAAAYHWFMRGLLVWILITQIFVFYSSQLAGLGGLAIDLMAYGSLRFALSREIVAGRRPQGTAVRRG